MIPVEIRADDLEKDGHEEVVWGSREVWMLQRVWGVGWEYEGFDIVNK